MAVGTDVGVAVELGRILATGEGVGSSEHPGRSMARSIAPASSTLIAMDFGILPAYVIQRDCGGQESQAGDHPKHHLQHTGKLGLGTKQEIVVWAVRNGLLDD